MDSRKSNKQAHIDELNLIIDRISLISDNLDPLIDTGLVLSAILILRRACSYAQQKLEDDDFD